MNTTAVLAIVSVQALVTLGASCAFASDESEELKKVSGKATETWQALNPERRDAADIDAKNARQKAPEKPKRKKSAAKAHASALGKDWNDLSAEERAEIKARVRARDRKEADAMSARQTAARADADAKAQSRVEISAESELVDTGHEDPDL